MYFLSIGLGLLPKYHRISLTIKISVNKHLKEFLFIGNCEIRIELFRKSCFNELQGTYFYT